MSERKTILILYYTRGVFPLRDTISKHLYCWRSYSKHETIYVNIALGFPWEILKSLKIDVVIFHTSFCGMRWNKRVFYNFTTFVEQISQLDCLKIAVPQDEFIHTDLLCEMCEKMKVDVILTCTNASEWKKIYGVLNLEKVKLKTVLTGYLDDKNLDIISKLQKPVTDRSKYIGYRAWRAAYWLGEHAMHKVKVGEIFLHEAQKKGLENIDISLEDSDTLAGNDWFKFLADCRATVGVEGGASILDADGSLKERVENFLKENPGASFEATREACFPGKDHQFKLACISPRHLEAALTKTCQLLIKADYNGILESGRHYIPIKPDYSNIDEVLTQVADSEFVQEMVDRAYEEVVLPGKFSYSSFVQSIEEEFIDGVSLGGIRPASQSSKIMTLNMKDWANWRIIQSETAYLKHPKRYKRIVPFARPVYKMLVSLPKF